MREIKQSGKLKKSVYVMTVGTGTAGRTSNLAQGLVNAINLRKEQIKKVFLVPSLSEDSHAIADLVIDNFKNSGLKVSIINNFTEPDELLRCRREFREVLSQLKAEQVIINPTSGTKQMTAGATLAALDMGLGVIEFIVGERRDGVVVTGTERIESLDSARLQAEQSIRSILALLRNGSYSAAALLGELIKDHFPVTAALCSMLAAWDRMNYSEAVRCVPLGDEFSKTRALLGSLTAASEHSLERIADLLALASRDLQFSRVEEALSAIYRAVELMAKFHLVELECPPDMWFADHLCKMFNLPAKTRDRLYKKDKESKGKVLRLGLTDLMDILDTTGFVLCELRYEKRHWKTLQERNETRYGHGDKSVKKDNVQKLYDVVFHYAVTEWAELAEMVQQSAFPDIESTIQKEINNESK